MGVQTSYVVVDVVVTYVLLLLLLFDG